LLAVLLCSVADGKRIPKYERGQNGGVPTPGTSPGKAEIVPEENEPAAAVPEENELAAAVPERKYSEYLTEEEKGSGICEQYCENPCSQFAWGSDTIKECNGCDSNKKCFPGAEYYGDNWIAKHNEL
jgi:hypothetical protein